MGLLEFVLIVSAVAVSWTAEATARGQLGVNSGVGIRVGYVTHSADAWLAGHRAARLLLHASSAAFAVAAVLSLMLPGITDETGALIAIAGCLVALGLVIAASVKAGRAAERVVVESVDSQNG
ncbi:SdpI family protein [Arthrobacter gengyunqii]|uniref:SdpI family protein n=1 Tax=Arthrobacter gengyunqii TaxID=2886940 RepID=A0A9X1M1G1_9MICC|nr:SdpI family protein [Arthrobacter gengyunqii]MCC3268639.1 SdpI family protein [Arthrobacter gengyunqii]UOY96026.1 SdpI family protein [Arthrobacter gengyunqii]